MSREDRLPSSRFAPNYTPEVKLFLAFPRRRPHLRACAACRLLSSSAASAAEGAVGHRNDIAAFSFSPNRASSFWKYSSLLQPFFCSKVMYLNSSLFWNGAGEQKSHCPSCILAGLILKLESLYLSRIDTSQYVCELTFS